MFCLDPRALCVKVLSGDEWYPQSIPLSRAAAARRTGARGRGSQPMPCCRSELLVPAGRSSLSGGSDFDLGTPLRRQLARERLCQKPNALSSESTVPKCHVSGWIGYGRLLLPGHSCSEARSQRTFQGVRLPRHHQPEAFFIKSTSRFRKKLIFFFLSHSCKRFIQREK